MGTTVRLGFWLLMLVLVGTALSAYWIAPLAFYDLELKSGDIVSLMLMVLVVTLFVERAQEVILTNWRAQQSEELDLKISQIERKIRKLSVSPNDTREAEENLRGQLDTLNGEKLAYRARTRLYALRLGVLMGVAVSIAGVRVLGALVPNDMVLGFGMFQQIAYTFIDVILTAGVVAGGSDGVHKMAELYRVFVETKSKVQRNKLSPSEE